MRSVGGSMAAAVIMTIAAIAVLIVLGELLVPGSWACFPEYCT